MNVVIPSEIKQYMNLIKDAGYECYLVGGAVRDLILGFRAKDYDFCTNIPLDKLKELIPNLSIMKEREHRNVGIIRDGLMDIEFSTFKGKTLKEDLSNRDFTMNAIGVDDEGNLIDYFEGIQALKNKKIELVKKDGSGLEVDPLRILRAIRQSIKYNFEIDKNTKKNMLSKSSLLEHVAPDRVYKELKEILLADNIDHYLMEYKLVFFQIIPELRECDGFKQHNIYHIYDVYTHIVHVVKSSPNSIYLRLAALFHDIGKPRRFSIDDHGIGHFYGHPKVSLTIFKNFAKKYNLDNKTKKIVSDLILYHEDSLSEKPAKIYKFYKRFDMNNIEMLFDLKVADALGQNPKYGGRISEMRLLEEKYISFRNSYNSIKYNGRNLISLGLDQKQIGKVLDDIKFKILTNHLLNDESLINEYVLKKYDCYMIDVSK